MTPEDLPYVQLHEFYPEVFRKIVNDAILRLFKPEIRKVYFVDSWAQMPDGKLVVRLQKRVLPLD